MKELSAEEKYQQMTQAPVERLICQLAVPTIISMLITTIYNMADTFYIGKLNTSASGAVGVVFSLMSIIQAAGFFFGQGAGNNASRELGKKRYEYANRLATVGFVSALVVGLSVTVLGLCFLRPLAMLLGSTDTILPYAMDYMRYILIGASYMAASLVLNNLLRFQGNAFYGMIGLVSGGLLNIALDPLFIFVFNMGISGAGLATILSQLVSFCVLFYQCHRIGIVQIGWKYFKPSREIFKSIAVGGTPSLCRQGIAGIAVTCLNIAAKPYGDAAIAAMAIVNRITNFTNSVTIGFGQGFQPVCGYNYGAKLYDRVRKGFWFGVKASLVFLLVLSAAEAVFAEPVVEIFRKGDPKVLEFGAAALRYQCITIWLSSFLVFSNMMLQTTGKVFRASFLSLARQGMFLIPLVLLLPKQIGFLGIQIAQPISDVLSLGFTIPMVLALLREMKRDEQTARLAE